MSATSLQARIDRSYSYGDYWIWAKANLAPAVDMSVVVQDGESGYACFVKGQNNFAANLTTSAGCADSYLTDYLVHYSHQFALPWLLQTMLASTDHLRLYKVTEPLSQVEFIAIEHDEIGLSILVDDTTFLPYKIRSSEYHWTFGNSTSDLLLSNYTAIPISSNSVSGKVLLPHRMQTIYNSDVVLEDFKADTIQVNPVFGNDFFAPTVEAEAVSPRKTPSQSTEYPRSEVHEFFEAGMWAGPLASLTVSDVVVEYPLPGIRDIMAVYVGQRNYVQLVVNFSDGLLVTDAPAHRSHIIIEWAKNKFNKSITHVVPSHHHHDHALGVVDYAAAGATLVIPTVAKDYYSKVNGGNVKVQLYTEQSPFVLRDGNVQFRSFWRDDNPHARDWSYSVATRACPQKNDTVVAHIADVWTPQPKGSGLGNALTFDIWGARQWLDNAVRDGIPKSAVVVGAHGIQDQLSTLLDITGYRYPNITIEKFVSKSGCY